MPRDATRRDATPSPGRLASAFRVNASGVPACQLTRVTSRRSTWPRAADGQRVGCEAGAHLALDAQEAGGPPVAREVQQANGQAGVGRVRAGRSTGRGGPAAQEGHLRARERVAVRPGRHRVKSGVFFFDKKLRIISLIYRLIYDICL